MGLQVKWRDCCATRTQAAEYSLVITVVYDLLNCIYIVSVLVFSPTIECLLLLAMQNDVGDNVGNIVTFLRSGKP